MRLPRFRIQTLMIAVFVVGLLVVGARAYALRRHANHYATSARYWTWQAENAGEFSRGLRGMTEAECRDGCLRRVRWDIEMRDKYLRAASRP